MNNTNKIYKLYSLIFLMVVPFIYTSCEDNLNDNSFDTEDVLTLTISEAEVVLQEQFINNTLSFNWSTGSNQNTGSAIKYSLEIDLAGNDFSNPIVVLNENVKNTFSHALRYGDLNNYLLQTDLENEQLYELMAKVTATFADQSLQPQTSTTNFNVTTFKPVSNKLFILGDATPIGWDIVNAIELTSSTSQRGVFIYKGDLGIGNFKFAVTQDACFCQDSYTRDSEDPSKIIHNIGGSGEDLQWTINQALASDEEYAITVDLINKSIDIEIVASTLKTPPFSSLWIVGDASESGWNIDSPVSFTQSESNPFEFYYEGQLNPGNFKIFAGSLGDWCGEWYRPSINNQDLTNGLVDQNSGCDLDNSWMVSDDAKGRYKITVDTQNNNISFNEVSLYIIGDAGPNGWNINTPEPMDYVDGQYVFLGPLGADNPTGEFKISKFIGEWCDGDWINAATTAQSITNTNFIFTNACDGPDNKWQLQDGDAGDYEIRINLDTESITITKQ